jgi:hypothetical protein
MATTCLFCGKELEVKRYRQCTTYCSTRCSRKYRHSLNNQRKTFMKQLREDNKTPTIETAGDD